MACLLLVLNYQSSDFINNGFGLSLPTLSCSTDSVYLHVFVIIFGTIDHAEIKLKIIFLATPTIGKVILYGFILVAYIQSRYTGIKWREGSY